MSPGILNLAIRQGDTFSMTLTLSNAVAGTNPPQAGTPINLTGCSASMQIRKTIASSVTYALTSASATPNGGLITLGGTLGTVSLYIPAADTASLITGVYDLKITFSDGTVQTFVAGQAVVSSEVTR